MRFLSADACRQLLDGRGFHVVEHGRPTRLPADQTVVTDPSHRLGPELSRSLSFDLASTQTVAFARAIVDTLVHFDDCLMWVTLSGVWPSSENLHLYYRLRQSYGERTLLHEAPGHLFLAHERPDFTSFVQLAILFGWDFHLLPLPDRLTLFVSHDEYVSIHADTTEAIDATAQDFAPFVKSP